MKRLLALLLMVGLVFSVSACSKEEEPVVDNTTETDTDTTTEETTETESGYKLAMITDSGNIDDESFNQGTWEGIVEFAEANNISYKYYKPLEVSDNAYLDTISLAIEGGAEVVVTPGFLFEPSVYEAQTMYPDTYFILIDGAPHTADYSTFFTAENTLSVFFDEHESGFLAGYAAVKGGYTSLGFVGGMSVPPVIRYGVGYVAGAEYAAHELGIDIELSDFSYHYTGDFNASDDAKNLAASWYVNGTEVIFPAAGSAGLSVMAAAEEFDGASVIGCDVDQSYLSDTVVLSAMKRLQVAVQQGLQAWLDDAWVGGVSVFKNATNDGTGLSMDSNLIDGFTQADYDAIFAQIKNGSLDVPSSYEELVAFTADFNVIDMVTEAKVNNA